MKKVRKQVFGTFLLSSLHLMLYSFMISTFSSLLELSYALYLWQMCIFQYDSEMLGLLQTKINYTMNPKYSVLSVLCAMYALTITGYVEIAGV